MASIREMRENGSVMDSVRTLRTDTDTLRREAHGMEEAATIQDKQALQRKLELLNDHLQRPATINSIEVHGAKNTRKGFLNPLFAPLVCDSRNTGTTLGEVLSDIQAVTNKLERFGVFKPAPTVFLADARERDPQATSTDLDVSIRVAEQSRLILKTGTDLGNTEGSAYGNLLWRNIFGGAETLSLNASAGTRTRSAYSAALSAPFNSSPDMRVTIEGLASSTEKPWASHEEVLKGGAVKFAWLSEKGDSHNISYGGAWRQLTGLAGSASPTVRSDSGDSVKSSITHTFSRDRRDNPMLPQSGYMIKTTSELAGWGPLRGDVAFSKSEIELGGAVPVPLPGVHRTGISIGGGFRFGVLYPLALGWSPKGEAIPSLINDRFQLGGPTDVRGFKMGGLGPRDGHDAVGGDVFAAGGVNMLLPLPRTGADSPLRLQLFANAGRLVALKNKSKAREKQSQGLAMSPSTVFNGMTAAVGELANGLPSTAVGFGLVYAHPIARFELNFSLPLVLRRGEEARKGLSVGVGINFL